MEEVSLVEPASAMHGAEAAAEPTSSSPTDEMYRAQFAAWLGNMGDEARQLAFLLERDEASAPLRRLAADSLNQLLHMADMVPDGTEALGYLETLFSFRLLAAELSEAAYSAPRLPKPRPPVPDEPAAQAEAPPAEERQATAGAVEAEASAGEETAGTEQAEAGSLEAGSLEAGSFEAGSFDAGSLEAGPLEEAGAAQGEQAAQPLEAAEAEALQGEAAQLDASELAAAEAEAAETGEAQSEAAEAPAQAETAEDEAAQAPAQAEAAPPELDEPERAQASDESYAVARRLAPQAALVRAFLGGEDADRLRRLVLEQRSRAARGRSSKEVLLSSEARAAAANEAREWAELYEAPEFGSLQHDLLRLRTFMRTRIRRTAS